MSLDAHDAAYSTAQDRTGEHSLHHPNDVELQGTLKENVWRLLEAEDPENTKKAYEPKMKEYFEFCKTVYPTDPHFNILNRDKMYRFMYFQAFREKKKRGGRRSSNANKPAFDVDAYRDVMSSNLDPTTGTTAVTLPTPACPVSKCVIAQYKATFRKLYNIQKMRGVLSAQWDDLWTKDLDDIAKHVRERAPKLKKESYEEKVSNEFAPYLYVDRYPDIETELWNDSTSSPGHRSIASGLRHRYVLLHLTSGILRCESLYKAELSDFLGVVVPANDRDAHRMFIMVNQIPFGKTNHGRTLYGRATRHRDVKLCAVAAFSFYLQYRLFITDEFLDFTADDWCDNRKWFDIKLLIDVSSPDKMKSMKNDSYSRKMKSILQRLNLPVSILVHLGRKLAPKLLDCYEEESREIERLGNWNPSLVDATYSSKLPLKPIRTMAGYPSKTKFYYLPRGTVEPSEELLQSTPMGRWVYTACEQLEFRITQSGGSSHQTAHHFLCFMKDLNKFFLQDAAAMIIEDEGRANHALFNELAVFKTQAWVEYVEKMKQHLTSDTCPLDAKLENVIPGLHQWHRANDASLRQLSESIEDLKGRMQEDNQSTIDSIVESLKGTIANALTNAAGSFSPPPAQARPSGQPTEAPANAPLQFVMKQKHNTLSSLYQEWYGLGEYDDSLGGVDGRNKNHGTSWRKHINRQHYSRTNRIVTAVDTEMERTGKDWAEVVETLEQTYVEANKSLAKMVDKLKQSGLVPVGRKRKAATQSDV